MSDPEVIRNTSPHAINMPVGGRHAMGKSAHGGYPAVRPVLAKDDVHPTAPPAQPKTATLVAHETANPVAPAEDQRADTPMPQASEYAIAVAADLKAQISDELTRRLATLKAENKKVLQQLDALETLMGHQP